MQSARTTVDRASGALSRLGLTLSVPGFVGGADAVGSGGPIEVLDPSAGKPFASFAEGDSALVDAAVQCAATAQQEWSGDGLQRALVLHEISRRVRAASPDVAVLESSDTGKPLPQARADVETAARYFEFYAGIADKIYGEAFDQATGFAYTRREPYGVVGVITPWNSPIAQMARSVAPALAAGNAVVVKPSELTPTTSVVLARLMDEAGLPPGTCNVVLGTGAVVGAALVEHPAVAYISFTGSVRTGRAVGRAAGERIVGVSLELGGKSPTIILADADIDAAAAAGVGAVIRNSGQSCFATTRLIVHRSVHDELVERMIARMDRLTVGPGLDAPDLGPLVSAQQLERVRRFVERAVVDGAEVVNDATAPVPEQGFFIRPHLLVHVDNTMEIAREEVFGPVQCVIAVEDDEEAVAVANDSNYGLAAGVFTSSLSKAHRVAARLQAGQVQINRFPSGGIDTAFGGYKQSGLGREKGVEAVRHYTQLKTVIVDLGDRD